MLITAIPRGQRNRQKIKKKQRPLVSSQIIDVSYDADEEEAHDYHSLARNPEVRTVQIGYDFVELGSTRSCAEGSIHDLHKSGKAGKIQSDVFVCWHQQVHLMSRRNCFL